jgi:Glycosyl hydrolases family 35
MRGSCNNDAIKVFYKNNYRFGVSAFNPYMVIAIPHNYINYWPLQIYGGTNWGNLGYHGGSATYDYGAAKTEDRLIWRETYSGMKLDVNF